MNILLVRLGRLGDVVMLLPAIRALQARYPEATLHAITTNDGARILKKVGILPEHCWIHQTRWYGRRWSFYKMQAWIKQRSWDHIFVFETKAQTLKHCPASAQVLPETEWNPNLEHYSERCLRFVQPDLNLWPQGPFLEINPDHRARLSASLRAYDINESTVVIGFHPTYSGFNRWGHSKEKIHRLWPVDHFVTLAHQLTQWAIDQNIQLKIIMDLLPSEQSIGQEIQKKSNHQVILLPSEQNFDRYLCYLKRLNLLIVPNTGVMHLASVLHTPMVALFSKHKSFYSGPWMPCERFRVLRAEDTPTPDLGLSSISSQDVFRASVDVVQKSLATIATSSVATCSSTHKQKR